MCDQACLQMFTNYNLVSYILIMNFCDFTLECNFSLDVHQ